MCIPTEIEITYIQRVLYAVITTDCLSMNISVGLYVIPPLRRCLPAYFGN